MDVIVQAASDKLEAEVDGPEIFGRMEPAVLLGVGEERVQREGADGQEPAAADMRSVQPEVGYVPPGIPGFPGHDPEPHSVYGRVGDEVRSVIDAGVGGPDHDFRVSGARLDAVPGLDRAEPGVDRLVISTRREPRAERDDGMAVVPLLDWVMEAGILP